MKDIIVERKTKETDIKICLKPESKNAPKIKTPLPFFSHMLNSAFFHGGFDINIEAAGDIEVDPHHLVEDTGIVLGQVFRELFKLYKKVARYGDCTIPMDDALCQVVIDVCERSYLVYKAEFSNPRAGDFDLWLLKEFFTGFTNSARINLHIIKHYGENGHHEAEAAFKAWGIALSKAYKKQEDDRLLSTKGSL
ncbi:imidazoleglycerol-phosphate dehydratase HisB [Spirochaetia bacterium 38H-sp]|uniref:Imidazoleglycerol-phosphate dehydratase n=1 Tax=Rarispira pelagica TaxID=3141764 RepID=A0ABU9UD40_9SPIR